MFFLGLNNPEYPDLFILSLLFDVELSPATVTNKSSQTGLTLHAIDHFVNSPC